MGLFISFGGRNEISSPVGHTPMISSFGKVAIYHRQEDASGTYDFLLVLAKKPEYFLSAFLLPQWGHLTGGWASNSFMER